MSNKIEYVVAFPARDAVAQGFCPSLYKKYSVFREVFDIASHCMGEDIYKITYEECVSRPDMHTVCLIAHSYATYKIFTQYFGLPSATIGFSQGEFTAVTVAGTLEFTQVLKLVYRLDKLATKNEDIKNGYMARVIELDRSILNKCCRQIDSSGKFVSVGISLSQDQNVISGNREYMDKLCQVAKEAGARWVIPLNSGGAFHSALCTQILSMSDKVFDEFVFNDAMYEVYSCVDGKGEVKGKKIKDRLSRQIAMPILWNEVINNLNEKKVKHVFELGPGCTVSGNSRIICSDISYRWINRAEDLNEVIKLIER